jgi:hypothetical protein
MRRPANVAVLAEGGGGLQYRVERAQIYSILFIYWYFSLEEPHAFLISSFLVKTHSPHIEPN